jgi:hypothetical protein
MEDTRQKLIAWALGDLSPEEFRALVPKLAADDDLQRQRDQIERTISVLRAMPSDDASDALVQRVLAAAAEPEQAEVIQLGWFMRALPRMAAAACIIFVFGLGVWITPSGLVDTVGEVTDGGIREEVLDSGIVESRVGETRLLKFATAEVLLDGASTVSVHRTGEFTPPLLRVERGRVVVTATSAGMVVDVADRSVQVEKGGMLAVNYDRAYANIAADGSVVEIQRMQIGDVAALAEEAYDIKLNAAGVPQGVRDIRVTFYGSDLNADKFIDSFMEATAVYGLKLDATRQYLSYKDGTSGPIKENDEWQLDIALLQGKAAIDQGGKRIALDNTTNFVSVSAAGKDRAERFNAEDLNKQVVWAAGADGALGERVRDVRQSTEDLPAGTVIHSDKMVLFGDMGKRIFKLGASEYDYILPGGRKGRVVQLTTSGAVFEVKGEFVREFVPFGEQ